MSVTERLSVVDPVAKDASRTVTPLSRRGSFRPIVPKELTGIPRLDEAIATYKTQMAKLRSLLEEIKQAEGSIRKADATDLQARASAELAGEKDPGSRATDKARAELEKLLDRRRVLELAVDDAATAIATLIKTERDHFLATTASDLEPIQTRFEEETAALERTWNELQRLQALRGWLRRFPKGKPLVLSRRPIVEGTAMLEDVLEALRDRARQSMYPPLLSNGSNLVALRGEGDERYPELADAEPDD
jgi:hypothetical protein